MLESSETSGPVGSNACTSSPALGGFFLLMGIFSLQSLIFVGHPETDDTLDRDPPFYQYYLSASHLPGLVLRTMDKAGSKTHRNACSPVLSSSGGES